MADIDDLARRIIHLRNEGLHLLARCAEEYKATTGKDIRDDTFMHHLNDSLVRVMGENMDNLIREFIHHRMLMTFRQDFTKELRDEREKNQE